MKTFLKPLTAREERECLERLKEGDQEAKMALIEHNMRLVAHVVKKYQYTDYEIEDLLSVGTIGLIKAVNTFNVDRGSRLATYAAKCVENEILMLLRAHKKYSREVSLYEPIGVDKDGETVSLVDVVEAENRNTLDELILSQDVKELYEVFKKCLKPNEQTVVQMRYGLFGGREYTQREIAQAMGISRSYPSVIIGIKLGKPLNGLRLYPYFYTLFTQPKLPKHILPQTTVLVYRYIWKTDRKTKGEQKWQKL